MKISRNVGKIIKIAIEAIPILIMISLIPGVFNDYLLFLMFVAVIVISLSMKCDKKDLIVFATGFILMFFFEILFIKTGVEVFIRNSLIGIMPIWLPLLWGYGFVAIKRAVIIISK